MGHVRRLRRHGRRSTGGSPPVCTTCFLSHKNPETHAFNASTNRQEVAEFLSLEATRPILMDPAQGGGGGVWKQGLRGAIVLAQRILVREPYFATGSGVRRGAGGP